MSWVAPDTYLVGALLTAASMNKISGDLNELPYQFDFASITAPVTLSGTTEGGAVTVVTGNAVTYLATQVEIEFFCPETTVATTSTLVFLRDSTVVGHSILGAITAQAGSTHKAFDTPGAGTHTYSVKGYSAAGTGVVQAGAGGAGNLVPAYMRVTNAPAT